jgi:hypothetical protein
LHKDGVAECDPSNPLDDETARWLIKIAHGVFDRRCIETCEWKGALGRLYTADLYEAFTISGDDLPTRTLTDAGREWLATYLERKHNGPDGTSEGEDRL